MARFIRNGIFVAAAMLILVGTSEAQVRLRVVPHASPATLPQFGMYADSILDYGLQVRSVSFGSRAWRMGMQPGDIILSLNDRPLSCYGAWHSALAEAMRLGGDVTLTVRDVRTGMIVYRGINVFQHSCDVHPYAGSARVYSSSLDSTPVARLRR
jgi:hypothetical protein